MIPLGRVAGLVRYPVKSMAGTATESAALGRHGLAGDRRYAFRRLPDESRFPWLTASRFPRLILYRPHGSDDTAAEPLPTHVRTPDGSDVELRSTQLVREIEESSGFRLELTRLENGIFDDAPVSVISLATIGRICRTAGVGVDPRRFRANIVLETQDAEPFADDRWVGATLVFGDREPLPAVRITKHDTRCMMINLDPDTAEQHAQVLKTVVRDNDKNAGVYGTVLQSGPLHVGQAVRLIPSDRGTRTP